MTFFATAPTAPVAPVPVSAAYKVELGCNASGVTADFVAGCHEAASRLALSDHHRLSDPDYKAGWTAAFAD